MPGDLEGLHPALTPRAVALLRQTGVHSLLQLLDLPPERLAALLGLPFTAAAALRSSLLAGRAPPPRPAAALSAPPALLPTGSPALDLLLGGGLRAGSVCEIFGEAGSGKTQVCLSAAAVCALAGGTVAYIDTAGDLCPDRLHQVVEARARELEEGQVAGAMDRVVVARPRGPRELMAALEALPSLRPLALVVVDSLSSPVMPLLTDGHLPAAFSLGGRASQELRRAAADGETAVMVTNNLRAGRGAPGPAGGGVWRGLADIRLLAVREGPVGYRVERVRGRPQGQGCSLAIGTKGVV